MTKRGRKNVLWENAPGGPRLVEETDTIDLTITTSDGKPAAFKNISRAKAERIRAMLEQEKNDNPLHVHKAKGTQPTIFDTLVNDMPSSIDGQQRIRGMLFRARHFVLDPAASQFVSKMAGDADLLQELREFAIPPFETIAISHFYGPEHDGYPKATFGERKAAFQSLTLWDRGEWKMFVAHEDGSSLACIPGWARNLPHGGVENPAIPHDEHRDRVIGSLALHRTIIDAFFLLLVQPKLYQVNMSEARKTLSKGRPVKFFARSEITIDLTGPAELRRAFRTGTHATPRWHEVRAHYVHRGGDRACTHAWTPVDSEDGKKRWTCDHCERRRTERAYPNGRGDAGKGFVQQKYAITATNA